MNMRKASNPAEDPNGRRGRRPSLSDVMRFAGISGGSAASPTACMTTKRLPQRAASLFRRAFLTAVLALGASGAGAAAPEAEFGVGVRELTGPDSPVIARERIVFLGDSITHEGTAAPNGFVNQVKKAFATERPDLNVEVIGSGVPGFKTVDYGDYRIRAVVRPLLPTAAFIFIGVNDVWHREKRFGGKGTTKEAYEAALRLLIGQLLTNDVAVVLASPGVVGEKTDGSNDLRDSMSNMPAKDTEPVPADAPLDEYTAISRRVAADLDVEFCDLRQVFLAYLKVHNPENKQAGILTRDGVHLTETGNRLVADEACRAIARALRRPAAMVVLQPGATGTFSCLAHPFSSAPDYMKLDQPHVESRLSPARLALVLRPGWKSDDVEIRYTLDGSEPGPAAAIYTKPFELTVKDGQPTDTVLRFAAVNKPTQSKAAGLARVTVLQAQEPAAAAKDLAPGLLYEYLPAGTGTAAVCKSAADFTMKPVVRAKGDRHRFTGWIEVAADGIYTVRTQARDRFDVSIGDWKAEQAGPSWMSRPLALKAGRHAFRLEYEDKGGPDIFINFGLAQGLEQAVPFKGSWTESVGSRVTSRGGGWPSNARVDGVGFGGRDQPRSIPSG